MGIVAWAGVGVEWGVVLGVVVLGRGGFVCLLGRRVVGGGEGTCVLLLGWSGRGGGVWLVGRGVCVCVEGGGVRCVLCEWLLVWKVVVVFVFWGGVLIVFMCG